MTREEADELVGFFNQNLVSVAFSNDHPNVYGMKLEETEEHKYKLVAGDGFQSYWCPYREDSVNATGNVCTLGTAADRMFTATMNGCSFGVGIPAGDGSVRVAHANTSTHEELAAIDDATMGLLKPPTMKNTAFNNNVFNAQGVKAGAKKQQLQLEQLKAHLAESGDRLSNKISRSAYNGCTSITTFALRVGTAWEFWFQGNVDANVLGCFPFPKVNPG